MTIITGIEHQPHFPHEDLSGTNASMMELLLQNTDMVENGHVATESVSWIHKVGHPTVVRSTGSIYSEHEQQQAINHGIKLFETMLMLVGAPAERTAPFAVERTSIMLLKKKTSEELRLHTFNVVDDIRMNAPNTSEVVRLAAMRRHEYLTHYSLLGAAMSRQFELDCVSQEELK